MIYDPHVQTIQPSMPNFYIQGADGDFVAEGLETAVRRREAHGNAPLNLEAQGLSVGSPKDAICGPSVKACDKIDPLPSGLQHNWYGYGIRGPRVGMSFRETDVEGQPLPSPER